MTSTGQEMFTLIQDLYPICRSITGEGFRESLQILGRYIPIVTHEVPTGTQVFDWKIPREWNVRHACICDASGRKVVDFEQSNLHLMSYSIPVHTRLPLSELKEHLFSLPEHPLWIPYRTSYYKENWGFCLSQQVLDRLEDGEYEVMIDTTLEDGSLTYAECFLPGEVEDEIFLSCHCCHPSLCNDNLSGMALATFLAMQIQQTRMHYSYRFVFLPGTIGAITWLALHEDCTPRIKAGLVIACVGDRGHFTYKKSRQGNAEIDQAVIHILKHSGAGFELQEFSPYGYDERQYCSPGFNLPVGSLTRTPHGRYPEYHTSADNLDFVAPEALQESYDVYRSVFDLLEHNRTYLNTNPKCEPQLGSRGLYSAIGGRSDTRQSEMAMLWVLNASDGSASLLDIANRSGMDFQQIRQAADLLLQHDLLIEVGVPRAW